MLIRCAPFSRTIYGFVPFARTFALKKPLLYTKAKEVSFALFYQLHKGYGPNYPVYGDCFDQDGHKVFGGALKIRKGGVGYPMVVEPENFGPLPQRERPEINWFIWDDARAAGIPF